MENLVNMAGFIMGAEFFVDNVKHCFIAKFNRLDRYMYTHFRGILAHDIVSTRLHMKETLDPTHSQGRRLGLPVIPITCVVRACQPCCLPACVRLPRSPPSRSTVDTPCA